MDQLNANINTLSGGVEELKNQVTDKIKEEKEAVSIPDYHKFFRV